MSLLENPKWHHRIPLTLKTVIIALVVGTAVWFILDHIQSRRIKTVFMDQLTERLGQQAMDDRLRFNRYVKAYHLSAALFVMQKNFSDYIEQIVWQPQDIIEIKLYKRPPPWYPGRSVLKASAQPRYALLLDPEGHVREIYNRHNDKLPLSLIQPIRLLIDKSRNQSYLTTLDNVHYLITSSSYNNALNTSLALLMLATPIDDSFLNASIGSSSHRDIVALLTPGENPEVLTSSNLMEIPAGIRLDLLKDKYLTTGKEFFDYGSSDLVVRFASFISVSKANKLTRSFISQERRERGILAVVFILSFAVVMFLIAQRIHHLTGRISEFSQKTLGTKKQEIFRGDQLYALEKRFQHLTEEVVRSREIIKEQAEEQTRLIVRNAFDAIITMDARGEIMTWNPKAEAIFGLKKEEATGRNLSDTIIPHRFRDAYRKGLENFLKMGKGPILDKPFETTACYSDGHEFPVEITVSHTATGNDFIFIAIIRDISERRKAEEERKLIQAKLIHTNKMTSLGTLVSGVAHEINNPNSFIMSNAQLFSDIWKDVSHVLDRHYEKNGDFPVGKLSHSELQEHVPRLLNTINKGTERIKQIVDSLKNFSRADVASLDEKVNVNEVVKTAWLLMRNSIKKSTDNYNMEPGEDIPFVRGNARQLEQVVINLLMNSLQAINQRNSGVWISTYYEKESNIVVIRVKDEGCGISKDILERVTEPFFTTKLNKGGTGLGLSISYGIIEEHGGALEFDSEPDRGTTVYVKLPMEDHNIKQSAN